MPIRVATLPSSIHCADIVLQGAGKLIRRVSDDYRWSIVGEPSGTYLWILTREAKPPGEMQRVLLERVRALGYDLSMLRRTQH